MEEGQKLGDVLKKNSVIFYTYLWLREDGTPYYAGKGKGVRWKEKHRIGHSWLNVPPSERVIIQEWPSESDAFEAEKFLISFYGRKDVGGSLVNRTDGGEGRSGSVISKETREKLRLAITGIKRSEDFSRKIGERIPSKKQLELRRRFSAEVRYRGTPWNKGKKGLQVAWNKGKGMSPEEKREARQRNLLRYAEKKKGMRLCA